MRNWKVKVGILWQVKGTALIRCIVECKKLFRLSVLPACDSDNHKCYYRCNENKAAKNISAVTFFDWSVVKFAINFKFPFIFVLVRVDFNVVGHNCEVWELWLEILDCKCKVIIKVK